jgi:hypothetical protein
MLAVGGNGYFRLSAAKPYLADGRLRLVAQAPEFSYSIHAIYSTRGETDLIDRVRTGLRACIA